MKKKNENLNKENNIDKKILNEEIDNLLLQNIEDKKKIINNYSYDFLKQFCENLLYKLENMNFEYNELNQKSQQLNLRYNEILSELKNNFDKEKLFLEQKTISDIKSANKQIIINFLEVLDNLEMMSIDNTDKVLNGCIERIYSILKSNNVFILDVKIGDIFDPEKHFVLFTESNNEKPGKIVKIIRRGFIMYEQIIRHTLVSVSE
jgi:molecular chaperone GrpE (heat shock protein)